MHLQQQQQQLPQETHTIAANITETSHEQQDRLTMHSPKNFSYTQLQKNSIGMQAQKQQHQQTQQQPLSQQKSQEYHQQQETYITAVNNSKTMPEQRDNLVITDSDNASTTRQ